METRVSGIRAIVFDLFRTLVAPEAVDPKAFLRVDRMAEELGLQPRALDVWWASSRQQRLRGRVPSLAELLHSHCLAEGHAVDLSTVERALDRADQYHDTAILHPPTEVIDTLRQLRERDFLLGILSNTDQHEIRLWQQSPLARMVDVVHLSVETGRAKPEPASYLALLQELGEVRPSAAAFVGDGESGELAAAKDVGFGKVVFMRGFVRGTGFQTTANLERFEGQSDAMIDRIPDLVPLLTP